MHLLSRHVCGMLLVITLLGCMRDEQAPAAELPALPVARSPTPPEADQTWILPELMDMIVDPAASVLFAAADQHAWMDFEEPRADEAWQAVVDAANQLARTSHTLADPALALGRTDWLEWTTAMRESADIGASAARRHDPRSLFAAGAQLRASCRACHARYAPPIAKALVVRGTRQ